MNKFQMVLCCWAILMGALASCDDAKDELIEKMGSVMDDQERKIDELSAQNEKFRQMFNVISPEQKCLVGDCVENDPDVKFRAPGPTHAWYIQTFNDAVINTFQYINAVVMCEQVEDPTWLLTFSYYKVDVDDPTNNRYVLGLGGSALVSEKTVNCWNDVWQKNKAKQIQ